MVYHKMKNKIYNIVGSIPISYRKMVKTEAQSILVTHIYITTQLLGLVQALLLTVAGLR